MITAFPKIFAIGTDYIRDIFNEDVEITEKIDGSQFAFGKINGELFMRSKGAQIFPETPEKMFSCAVDHVLAIQDKLPEGIVFYCEYLKNPKHNTLTYSRVPKNHLILFGACSISGTFITNHFSFCDLLEIDAVPIIYVGKISAPEELRSFLDRESVLGNAKIEGVVVKNYARLFLLGGQPLPLMSGKFVSEVFKETHRERWGTEETSSGKWAAFLLSFKTEARWEKAIQHLAESGELESSPRDIGKLIKEIQYDITLEEIDAIKSYLWNENKREILSAATKGFPEWYKDKLLKRSFTPEAV